LRYHHPVHRIAYLLIALAACKSDSEGEDLLGSGTATSKPNGSAGGFSAALSADLAKDGSGSAMGSGSGSAMGSGSGSAMGSAMRSGSGSGSATGSGSAVAMGSGSAAVAPVVVSSHTPAKVSPEVAAIQLKMLPRWERDIDEAGTFRRDVDAVSKQVLFVFHYGFDDPAAPKDREAYIKYLADKKLMLPAHPDKPLLNRQRGSAWYLEGVDGTGAGVFRYLVNYGDKHLICGGPMYRDTGLGDLRDEVIIQAKAICESIAL
jgi:hypothetical protein